MLYTKPAKCVKLVQIILNAMYKHPLHQKPLANRWSLWSAAFNCSVNTGIVATYCGVLYSSYKIPFHCLKYNEHSVRECLMIVICILQETLGTTCPTVPHVLKYHKQIQNSSTVIISGRVLARQREQTIQSSMDFKDINLLLQKCKIFEGPCLSFSYLYNL